MRVLVHPHASEIGGSQLNAVDLGAAVRDLGHEVVVACEHGPLVERISAHGLDHVALPRDARRPAPAAALGLDRIVAARGIEVVHAWEWPPAFDALGTRLRRGTAVVGSVMSMSVVDFYPRSVPLLVGTELIREAALAAGHDRVGLLEPPVDCDSDHPGVDGAAFRAAHGIDDSVPLVVMVCRLVPDLKLEGLLAACAAIGDLAAAGRKVALAVVGDGRSRDQVQAAADRANSRAGERVVTLTGALDDPRPAYAAADIVVGQGGSALRGMAFGKPLVVVGEGGFSEVVTPESVPRFLRIGWYGIGPGSLGAGPAALVSGLDRLLDSPQLREELGDMARRLVVERFSLEHAARLLVEEYERAMAEPVGVPSQLIDLARSGSGMLAHKVRRRVARHSGRIATDDANATPVREPLETA